MQKKLDDILKKPDFKVPDGYFDDLPMKIQQRIELERPAKREAMLPTWSLAMATAMIVVIGFVSLLNMEKNNVEELLADVSEVDLVAYIEGFDLDTYDIAATFPETTNALEFEDMEMMDGLELEDQSINDILLEYNLELDEIVI